VEFELIKVIISNFKAAEDKELVLIAKERLTNFLNSKDPNCKTSLLTLFYSEIPGLSHLERDPRQ